MGWWVVLPSIEINIRVTGNFSSKALIDPPSSRKKQKQCLKVLFLITRAFERTMTKKTMIGNDVNLVLYGTSLSVVLGKAAVTSDSVPVCSSPACLSALLLTSGELLLACLLLSSPACSSAQLLTQCWGVIWWKVTQG